MPGAEVRSDTAGLEGEVRNDQPIAHTMKPPPTWTAGIETPKKSRTYAPTRIEMSSRKKLLMATSRAMRPRSAGFNGLIMARYIGAAPSGSTIGNRAATTRKIISKKCRTPSQSMWTPRRD